MTKYCKYHYNNGHTTNECKTLQDKIEEFIRSGHLKQFVKREGQGNSRQVYNRNTKSGRQRDHRERQNERREHLPA